MKLCTGLTTKVDEQLLFSVANNSYCIFYEGRHYDERGNLHNWWDKETEKKFQRKTDCLAKQYGSVLVPEVNKTVRKV